jgi:peptidoglycan-N-acetylglucosamine deacetylase
MKKLFSCRVLALRLGPLLVLFGCSDRSPSPPVETIRTAVKVASTEQPKSVEEWQQSQTLFERLLRASWPKALKEKDLCTYFSTWGPQELLPLSEVITISTKSELPCREALLLRIKAQMSVMAERLNTTDLGLSPCRRKQGPPPWNLTVTVNPSVTPRLIAGQLPACTIAFTFDDGPHAFQTPAILNVLEKTQVKAVFFQLGFKVDRFPQISQAVVRDGHVIGNHSYSHGNMPKLTYELGQREIEKGFTSLFKAQVGPLTPFFRFPFGAFTTPLQQYLRDLNVTEFFWNMDTLDWKLKDPVALYHHTLKQIEREGRGIILFHDTLPQTTIVVPKVLEALREAGYGTALFVPEKTVTTHSPLLR